MAVLEICWAEVDNFLELHIYPFGEVPHAAVDAAHNGASFPLRLLVHFGSAVELWDPSFLFEASLEIGAL